MLSEEDIKILEQIKEIFTHLKNYGWINDIKRDIDIDKAIQSIEHLIQGYKEQNEVNAKFIPKSLVEEMIEEIDEEYNKMNTPDNNEWYIDSEKFAYAKEKIEELLKGDK